MHRHAAAVAAALFGAIIAIDGDSIRVDGTSYRLYGFDTPELGKRAKCEHERIWAQASKARMRELLRTTRIRVSEPVKWCKWSPCVKMWSNSEDVARIMIREGLAVRYYGGRKRKDWCA